MKTSTESDLDEFRIYMRALFSEKCVKNYPGPVPVVSIDTNRINAKQRLESMNEIERLGHEGWIDLRKSHVMLEELPDGPGPMRDKAHKTMEVGGEDLTQREQNLITELEQLLFPGKALLSINDNRDVRHLFDHMKYCLYCDWNFLITNDNAILNKKDELRARRINVGDDEACMQWLNEILPILKQRVARHFEK